LRQCETVFTLYVVQFYVIYVEAQVSVLLGENVAGRPGAVHRIFIMNTFVIMATNTQIFSGRHPSVVRKTDFNKGRAH
jgi:hypothetical protein